MIRKFIHKKTRVIGENDSESDYFLHFERGDGEVVAKEAISMEFVEESNDWEEIFHYDDEIERPTKWFETRQIETWVGETDNGSKNSKYINGGRAMLIVQHQCGDNKEWLIGQLKTMITNIETDGENFGS